MLKLINEELMSFSTIVDTDRNNGKSYTKIRVANSNKIFRYRTAQVDQIGHRTPNQYQQPHNSEQLTPLNVEVLKISAPVEDIERTISGYRSGKSVNLNLPMSLKVNESNNKSWVEVRCHEEGKDNTQLYVVAFPFNGLISPIPKNPQYRIYKGIIASSAKPLYFHNRKYRKVLYLVIGINPNLFTPSHKHYTDKISIRFDSYALFTDRETQATRTNAESMVLDIASNKGDYATSWEYNTLDEAVVINTPPGAQLWHTFSFTKDKNEANPKQYSKKNYNKPSYIEGDMVVSTNKHGIRKESSINKRGHNSSPRYTNNNREQSFDEMLAHSLNSDHFKHKGGNKGKRRNNNY